MIVINILFPAIFLLDNKICIGYIHELYVSSNIGIPMVVFPFIMWVFFQTAREAQITGRRELRERPRQKDRRWQRQGLCTHGQ